MNPDRIEEGLARLRTASPSPGLQTRILAVARDEWTRRSAARRAFRVAAWRWAAAVAAVWVVCIGVSLREDALTSRALASSRPAAPTRTDGAIEILREAGLNGAYARLWSAAAPDLSAPSSWAVLRTGIVL
ncbi:MAG: hypothetical protein FJ221_18650 [Lentisphaerae bacterium]|nr:hypothetical protein [Lentisphaerota bacterium]